MQLVKTDRIKDVKEFVEKISEPLADFIDEKDLQVAKLGFVQAIYRNKEISNCEPASVVGAFLQCAIYGLDPTQGEAYFIPRKSNIGTYSDPNWITLLNYETGYQGYLKIYEDLGYFIETVLVCKEDKIIKTPRRTQDGWEFEYEPKADFKTKDNILYGFTTIIYPNGLKKCFRTSIAEIERMRKKSKNQLNKDKTPSEKPLGVWAEWYDQMAMKSCVRRARKWIGRSINKNGMGFKDEGVLLANEYGIDVESPEIPKDELTTFTDEWVMDISKAEELYNQYKSTYDGEKELLTESYLNEVEIITGHREVKDLTQEQYGKLMESFK